MGTTAIGASVLVPFAVDVTEELLETKSERVVVELTSVTKDVTFEGIDVPETDEAELLLLGFDGGNWTVELEERVDVIITVVVPLAFPAEIDDVIPDSGGTV